MKGWAAEGGCLAGIFLVATANSFATVITCDGVLLRQKLPSHRAWGSISIIGDGQPVFNRFFLCPPFFA